MPTLLDSAIFKDGVFRPDAQVPLSDSTRVLIRIEAIEVEVTSAHETAWSTLRELWSAPALDSAGDRLTRDALHERR